MRTAHSDIKGILENVSGLQHGPVTTSQNHGALTSSGGLPSPPSPSSPPASGRGSFMLPPAAGAPGSSPMSAHGPLSLSLCPVLFCLYVFIFPPEAMEQALLEHSHTHSWVFAPQQQSGGAVTEPRSLQSRKYLPSGPSQKTSASPF